MALDWCIVVWVIRNKELWHIKVSRAIIEKWYIFCSC